MNYDWVGVAERLSSTRDANRRVNETQGGAARRADVGRVIIYELWWRRSTVGSNIVMNMLSSTRPLVESTSALSARERLRWPFYSFIDIQICTLWVPMHKL